MIASAEIQALSLQEKLEMMEVLWESISSSGAEIEVPQWQQDILAERQRLIDEGKAAFIDWDTAKNQIRDAVGEN